MNTPLVDTRGAARIRPITIAILAMGGEGGGVLADWGSKQACAPSMPVSRRSVRQCAAGTHRAPFDPQARDESVQSLVAPIDTALSIVSRPIEAPG